MGARVPSGAAQDGLLPEVLVRAVGSRGGRSRASAEGNVLLEKF